MTILICPVMYGEEAALGISVISVLSELEEVLDRKTNHPDVNNDVPLYKTDSKNWFKTEEETNILACESCDIIVSTSEDLEVHILKEHATAPGNEFQQKSTPIGECLGQITTKNGANVKKCSFCSFNTTSDILLNYHMVKNDVQMLRKCDYCDFSSTHCGLKDHIKLHAKQQCKFCDFKTARKSTLDAHTRRKHRENLIRSKEIKKKSEYAILSKPLRVKIRPTKTKV